jgi:hypothetical protein
MTAYKYPFKTGEELKSVASQIDISFEIENIDSSLILAANELKDIISSDVWDLMLAHYNSGNYDVDPPDPPGEGELVDYSLLNELVHKVQPALANLAFYHHFIWLMLRISSNSVTVMKGENETTAYKYQTDEAKEKLLEVTWVQINDLIDFLNDNATDWADFAASTAYEADDIARYEEAFYSAKEAFTSIEEFDAADWDEVDDADVIFHEWTLSEQYTESQLLIFKDYKEFDKYYGIDRSASFFIHARFIISEIIKDDIIPRTSDIYTSTDDNLLRRVKRYLAYKTVSVALFRFDFFYLPGSIRRKVNNEYTSVTDAAVNADFVKTKLAAVLKNKADEYLMEIDHYLSSLITPEDEDDTVYTKYEHTPDAEDKFVAMI